MRIHLYDLRKGYPDGRLSDIGQAVKWSLSPDGLLRIKRTDLGYNLHVQLTKVEMEALRSRLKIILDKKKQPQILTEVQEILNKNLDKR